MRPGIMARLALVLLMSKHPKMQLSWAGALLALLKSLRVNIVDRAEVQGLFKAGKLLMLKQFACLVCVGGYDKDC